MSRKVGDIRFSTSTSMRNEFSHIRKQHKVPGNMLNKKLAVGIPVVDDQGKKDVKNMWMHYVDYQFECEFAEEKNRAIAFGRSNRNSNGEYMNIGKSGNVIKTGAGLYEQMEYGNTEYYNTFSLKKLESALFELCSDKLDFNERTFILRTGQRGAALFHKAVLDNVSGWTQFVLDNSSVGVVQKTTSNLHSNALSAGFQFVEYMAPNGIRIKVEVDSMYDDPVRNKIMHPLGGPAMSYRFDIMDIGTMDQPNIFKCTVKGQDEYRGLTAA